MPDTSTIDHRLLELHHLLLPHVKPVIEKKIQDFIDNTKFTEQQIRDIMRMAGEDVLDQGGTLADAKAVMKDVRTRMRDLKSVPDEERVEAIEISSDMATSGTVVAWLMTLSAAAPGDADDERTLDLGILDDAMLPPHDPQHDMLFDMFLQQTDFDMRDVRTVLRAVRSSLPVGKFLPDPAVSLLLDENITVDDGSGPS